MAATSPAMAAIYWLHLQTVIGGEFFELGANLHAAARFFDQRADKRSRLAAIEVEQHRLDRSYRRGGDRKRAVADGDQRQRADRLRGQLAAQRYRLAMRAAFVGNVFERAQHRRRQRIEAAGHPRIAAIDGVEELYEVVRADREEIGVLEQFVELIKQRGDLDHAADLDLSRQLVAMAAQVRELALDQLLRLIEFADGGDHWKHDFQRAAAGGAQQRPELRAQQSGPIEPEPDRPPAERRILLLDVAHVRQHLVAADIERAEGHRLVAGGIEHGAVERVLLA